MSELMPPETVDRIIGKWSTLMDTWQGDSGPAVQYDYPHELLKATRKPDHKWRPLPDEHAEEARAYIQYLCKRYPLQLRSGLGLSMWLRFTDVWADTGKIRLAMRAI